MIAHDGDSFVIPTRFVEVESVVEEDIISSDRESENIDIINFKERPEKKNEPKDEKKDEMKEEIAEAKKAEEETLHKIEQLKNTCKPKAKQLFLLEETSIRDLLEAVVRMADYDRLMADLGMAEVAFEEEDKALERIGKPFVKELIPLPDIEDQTIYSSDPEIQSLVSEINDLTSIPDPPEDTKNAFAITLFCMETAFDCRSFDLLKHAFDLFPDRDYLVMTMPHTIPENALLSKFNLVAKKAQNTFSHVLYIFHKDYLYE